MKEWHKARDGESIKAMKCPTCRVTDSDIAEKEGAARLLGAGDGSSQSVAENFKSQSSQDDHGAEPTQAASGNSPATVAVLETPIVASDKDALI